MELVRIFRLEIRIYNYSVVHSYRYKDFDRYPLIHEITEFYEEVQKDLAYVIPDDTIMHVSEHYKMKK